MKTNPNVKSRSREEHGYAIFVGNKVKKNVLIVLGNVGKRNFAFLLFKGFDLLTNQI